jgi:VWFA-related protein
MEATVLLRWLAVHAAFCAVVVVCGTWLAPADEAAAQEATTLTIDQVVTGEDPDTITVYVSVLDAQGRPIEGLTGFSATVDDVAVEVTSVQPAVNGEIPIASSLAIDTSGSMAGEPLNQAKFAAAALVQDLFPNDVTAIRSFASSVELNQDFTSDTETLMDTIRGLTADELGGTALHDALAAAVEGAQGAPTERRTVILLTDGRDAGSEQPAADAIQLAASAGIPVFAVALGPDVDTSFLQQAVDVSGGALLLAPTSEDVPDVFAAIGEQLRGQYGLTIDLPQTEAEAANELIIRIDAGGRILSATAPLQRPPPPSSDDGGSLPLAPVAAFVVLVAAAVAGAVIWYRRRRRRPTFAVRAGAGVLPLPGAGWAAPPSQPPSRLPTGQLIVIAGPNAGASMTLSAEPVDIGAAPSCALRLDAADGTGLRHARVWLQHDRFVLHHLARGLTTYVDDKPVDWATLESEDTVRIGPHVLAVKITPS